MSKRLKPQLLEDADCEVRLEPLQQFCDDDQVPVCPENGHHLVYGIQESAENYRKLFQELLNPLKEKLEAAESILADEQERMVMVQEEEQNLKEMISSEFKMRFRLLGGVEELNFLSPQGCRFDLNLGEANHSQWIKFSAELEKAQEMLQRLHCLGRENRNKLKASVGQVSEQIQHLQRIKTELEKACGESALVLLQNARYYLERSESVLCQCLEPTRISDLSWCQIRGMSKRLMAYQSMLSPVRHITLDPGTAHPCLVLSDNLRSMTFGNIPPDVPSTPGTFDFSATVLGAESFVSGKHYWEVVVGKATKWQVGICTDRMSSNPKASGDKILLMGAMMGTDYTFWVFPPLRKIFLRKQMYKIGIFLDYDYGHISFYNVTKRSLIYNFSSLTFHGAIRPIFSLCIPNGDMNSDTLSICPLNVPT